MGIIGDALLESSKTFGTDSNTGIFLGFIFLTIFLGFLPLVVSFAINGKKERELTADNS